MFGARKIHFIFAVFVFPPLLDANVVPEKVPVQNGTKSDFVLEWPLNSSIAHEMDSYLCLNISSPAFKQENSYQGTHNFTSSGTSCQRWPDVNNNFCRNSEPFDWWDGSKFITYFHPWCFDAIGDKELCFPFCPYEPTKQLSCITKFETYEYQSPYLFCANVDENQKDCSNPKPSKFYNCSLESAFIEEMNLLADREQFMLELDVQLSTITDTPFCYNLTTSSHQICMPKCFHLPQCVEKEKPRKVALDCIANMAHPFENKTIICANVENNDDQCDKFRPELVKCSLSPVFPPPTHIYMNIKEKYTLSTQYAISKTRYITKSFYEISSLNLYEDLRTIRFPKCEDVCTDILTKNELLGDDKKPWRIPKEGSCINTRFEKRKSNEEESGKSECYMKEFCRLPENYNGTETTFFTGENSFRQDCKNWDKITEENSKEQERILKLLQDSGDLGNHNQCRIPERQIEDEAQGPWCFDTENGNKMSCYGGCHRMIVFGNHHSQHPSGRSFITSRRGGFLKLSELNRG